MDLWSLLCTSSSSNDQNQTSKVNKSRDLSSSAGSDRFSPSPGHPKSGAVARRLSFSCKTPQSFPSAHLVSRTLSTDLLRQFSLEDLAMQNNCTVISNKVGPVVIKNCKEEYQMRANARNVTGRLHKQSSEHELLLNKFFLLKDHFIGVDRQGTLEEQGVPNIRVIRNTPTIYAIGQPTMKGLEKFTTTLLKEHKWIYYVNVRAVPTLFLRRSGDFLPYSVYCERHYHLSKMYRTERELHDAEREIQLQALRIASTNNGMFFYYNVLDSSPNEPHMYTTEQMEDLVTSRQLYAKIQSEHRNFTYKRLVLANIGEPSTDWLESLIDLIKEIKAYGNENTAIVFQGLTGEGPATLAAILALLTTKSLSERDESRDQFERCFSEIKTELPWREYVLKGMLESSSLPGQTLRKEIDMAITKSSTLQALCNILSEIANFKGSWTLLGTNPVKVKNADVTGTVKKPAYRREESNGNLNLRHISELSLNTNKSGGVQRESQHIRYEVCDEERLLRSLLFKVDLYYFLLVFRTYVTEQESQLFQKPFSQWLAHNFGLMFDISQVCSGAESKKKPKGWQLKKCGEKDCEINLDPTFHNIARAPIFGTGQTTEKRFEKLALHLCRPDARKRYTRVQFVNVQEETCLYWDVNEEPNPNGGSDDADNFAGSRWELSSGSIPCMHGAKTKMVEDIEDRLKVIAESKPENVVFMTEDGTIKTCPGQIKTTKDVFAAIRDKERVKNACHILYRRIPLPRYRIPRFECFDKLVEMVRDETSREDSSTAFVFFCHNGKKRSTNMMVAACLVLAHMGKFHLDVENCSTNAMEPWAPDVEFTRGEYKVVLELIQILPDCHLRKKEVDAALDHCYESMSTMHYHLREHLNPSYKKAKKATSVEKYLTLKHQSYLALELYVFLILFDTYLHEAKEDLWRALSFENWMSQHATRLGVVDVLNNLGFVEFGEDQPMNLLRARWMDTPTLCRKIEKDASDIAGIRRTSNGTLSAASSPSQ